MPSLESPRTPLQPTNRAANNNSRLSDSSIWKTAPAATSNNPAKMNGRFENILPRSPAHHEHKVYEDDQRHCDPRLFHELVEEPDDIFADDIDALGVHHAGVPETPVAARKSGRMAPGNNAMRQGRQGKARRSRRAKPEVLADPKLFREVVEEPDVVFADDIYALGVAHAGTPDLPRRKTRPATANTRQAKRPKRDVRERRTAPPSAEDLHWDSDVMHEVVEEPDDVFGDDIDALGVRHAGVPDTALRKTGAAGGGNRKQEQANQAKRYARALRTAPSADDLHWDSDVMHEVVEEPDDIFGDDIDALGVRHAGVPDTTPAPSRKRPAPSRKKPVRVIRRRLGRAAPSSDDLVWDADADIIHEIMEEEPDFIFGEDSDALGVRRGGMPDHPRYAKRRVRPRRVAPPGAEDLHWDVGVMNEVVEDPEAVFGEDIDALGVAVAGVSDSSRSTTTTKPTTRRVARRSGVKPAQGGGSRHRLRRQQHADPRLFRELVEEPDALFGEDIDALGVAREGVPDDSGGRGINISANGIRLNFQATREGTSVMINFPRALQ